MEANPQLTSLTSYHGAAFSRCLSPPPRQPTTTAPPVPLRLRRLSLHWWIVHSFDPDRSSPQRSIPHTDNLVSTHPPRLEKMQSSLAQRQQPQNSQTRTLETVTQTQTQTQTRPPTATLRLRGAHTANNRSVQWAEDVVDNEGMNRKKSKGTLGASPVLYLPRLGLARS